MHWQLFIFGSLLPRLLVGRGAALAHLLLRQNGRLLLRIEAFEQHLHQLTQALAARPSALGEAAPDAPSGLPVGAPAPAFALPDLAGRRASLADFPGPRLLIFFNPRCGFCTRMAPDIATLPTEPTGGRPLPIVITTGDARARTGSS